MIKSVVWFKVGLILLSGINLIMVLAMFQGNVEVVFSCLMTDVMVVCFILDHGEDMEEKEKKEFEERMKKVSRDLPI